MTGPTGSGKTVFLSRMAIDDLAERGRALVVIDPKDGGLVDRILEAMPEDRIHDVVIFDPTDERPIGFNPIACTPDNREPVVDQIVSIMAAVWKSSWGPRSSDLIRHALLTLTQVPGMTMVEAPRLLTDRTFRRHILSQVDDPLVTGSFWAWFDSLSPAEQASIVAPPMNKLRSLTSRQLVRHEISQANPSLDFDRILNRGGVLLVRLSSGLLGEETASLLGALITAQLWQAVAAGVAVPSERRPPAMVIIDEVQSVLRLPVNTIEDMLTQARGYGVGVTLAHQHLQQLSTDVREAAMAYTRSKVIFARSQKDAATFAKELACSLTADDLRDIEAHEAVASVYASGRTQPPTTIEVLPPATPLRSAEVVRALSRTRYGTDRAEVEAEIRARRVVAQAGDGPIGRMALDEFRPKRGRKVSKEDLEKRLAVARKEAETAVGTTRLLAIQMVADLEDRIAALARTAESGLDSLEARFAKHAKAYGEAKGISYASWRAAGVPAELLKRAGIGRGSK